MNKKPILKKIGTKKPYIALFLFLITPLVFEAITFPGSFQKYTFVPAWLLSSLALVCSAILAHTWHKKMATSLQKLGLLLFLSTYILVIVLFFIEQSHFPNYVFSTYHLHLSVMRFLPLCIGAFLTITNFGLDDQRKLAVLPVLLLLCASIVSATFPSTFLHAGMEGGLIEMAQVIILLLSLVIVLKLVLLKTKLAQTSKPLVICLALILFFLIGEELSWGQHIFHFPSLPFFLKHNVQKEGNIHNLRVVQDILFNTYILIGGMGSFGWTAIPLLKKSTKTFIGMLIRFVPHKLMSPYFLPLFIYGVYRVFYGPVQIKTWEESCEFLAYSGIFLVTHRLHSFALKHNLHQSL